LRFPENRPKPALSLPQVFHGLDLRFRKKPRVILLQFLKVLLLPD